MAAAGDADNTEANPDVVAPGEEEEDARKSRSSFEKSAMQIASAASGLPREKWGSPMQFLMSCIASAVGLGNVWRFPAVCASNGGAAFIIPYFIVLTIIARPLFLLELALGQFSSKGSVRCWDLSPIFTGIGYTGSVSSVLLSTFYIMLMAWSLIYMSLSLHAMFVAEPLWNDPGPGPFFGGKILGDIPFNCKSDPNCDGDPISAAGLAPKWHLALALFAAWFIIWITMVFGVEASGKVAYITALAPYFVLVLLMIVGFTLDGMTVGLKYMFVPQWGKLLVGKTWFEAVGQCFFSLGIGFGGCIMFSSFNEFHNNITKDVLIVSLVDMFTSILAGLSLMSILGFQARTKFNARNSDNQTMTKHLEILGSCSTKDDEERCYLENMVGDTGGGGLAFVHYPAAMSFIQKHWGRPWGGLFAFFFFFMLILLAVGSANGFVGTTVTILCDKYPTWKRRYVVSGVCSFSCMIGLIYTNGIGSGWFDVVDLHGVTAVVYVLAFLEAVAVIYVYGLKNFCDDMEYMQNGRKVGWYLRITWVTLPILMAIIFGVWCVTYQPLKTWTLTVKIIAWSMTIGVLLVFPLNIIIKALDFKAAPWRKNVSICQGIVMPAPRWGPKDPEIRLGWKRFKATREPSWYIWQRYILRRKPESVQVSTIPSYATQAGWSQHGSKIKASAEHEEKEQTPSNEQGHEEKEATEKKSQEPIKQGTKTA